MRFSLEIGDKRIDDGIQFSMQNIVQLVKGQSDSVVGYPTLGEIVCPYPFTSVSGADHVFTLQGYLRLLFCLL